MWLTYGIVTRMTDFSIGYVPFELTQWLLGDKACWALSVSGVLRGPGPFIQHSLAQLSQILQGMSHPIAYMP